MRRVNDFYPTPEWATRELLERVAVYGTVLEPCVGAGDMAAVLRNHLMVRVLTNDLDRNHPADYHEDATDPAFWRRFGDSLDWVVTNPPFIVADRILPLAVRYANHVAMLLRLTYLEPCEGRALWLANNPPSALIVLPRISFTGDGKTDSATCAWMVWSSPHQQSIEIVPPLDTQEPALLAEAR